MSALQGAVNAGARHVFAVEPAEWKHDLALKFGATKASSDIETALAQIAELTAGRMAHKVIVTVGRINGADIERYLSITAKGGTCVLTAMGAVMETDVTLNVAALTLSQKNLQGSIFGHGNPQHDIPILLSLYQAGKLNLDDMVTPARRDQRRLSRHARRPQHPRHHPLHRRRPLRSPAPSS